MLKKDIEQINEYLGNLRHYNKRVAECWYRVRDFSERIIEVAEEPSTNNESEPCSFEYHSDLQKKGHNVCHKCNVALW